MLLEFPCRSTKTSYYSIVEGPCLQTNPSVTNRGFVSFFFLFTPVALCFVIIIASLWQLSSGPGVRVVTQRLSRLPVWSLVSVLTFKTETSLPWAHISTVFVKKTVLVVFHLGLWTILSPWCNWDLELETLFVPANVQFVSWSKRSLCSQDTNIQLKKEVSKQHHTSYKSIWRWFNWKKKKRTWRLFTLNSLFIPGVTFSKLCCKNISAPTNLAFQKHRNRHWRHWSICITLL